MTKPSNLAFAPEDLTPFLPSCLPLLRAQDICYYQSSTKDGRHNLPTWLSIVANDATRKAVLQMRISHFDVLFLKHVIECAIVVEGKKMRLGTLEARVRQGRRDLCIFDTKKNSRVRLANAWNRGVKRLGYGYIIDD